MILLQPFLWATVVLLAAGPWPYASDSPLRLYGYVSLIHMVLFVGYAVGVLCYKSLPIQLHFSPRATTWLLIVAAAWLVPSAYILLGGKIGDPASFATYVLNGLTNPGQQYNLFRAYEPEADIPKLLQYLNVVIHPIAFAAVPCCLFWWRQLSLVKKGVLVAIMTFGALSWVARGTNNGLFQILLIAACAVLAGRAGQHRPLTLGFMVRLGGIALAGFAIATFYFAQGRTERNKEEHLWTDPVAYVSVDPERPLMLLTPTFLQPALIGISSYACQGYYALSLALDEPFVPCYGLGNSYFLQGMLRKYLPTDTISDQSYPGRLEQLYGWDRNGRWHTFYVWFASDITFIGVIALVGIIGWLLALVWLDAIHTRHYLPIALLPLLFLMVVYFSANNQVLGFASYAVPFLAGLPAWLIWRVRQQRGV